MALRAGIGRWEIFGLIVLLALGAWWAKSIFWSALRDRAARPSSAGINPELERDLVAPPPVKPQYSLAPELRDQYPQATAFMRQFLETCLAGDYGGYRRLVSGTCDPGSRDRFEKVFHGIRSLRIESIKPIDLPRLSDEVYLVVSQVDFHPDSRVRLRRKTNAVAILVLKEEGDWRMMPAPSWLQPTPQPPPTTTSAPTTSAPSYPWDEDGEF